MVANNSGVGDAEVIEERSMIDFRRSEARRALVFLGNPSVGVDREEAGRAGRVS